MGATRLAGAFDVTPYDQATTFGSPMTALTTGVFSPEAQAKRAFAIRFGHAEPANLNEAMILNDMVAQAKLAAATVRNEHTSPIPTVRPNTVATGGGGGAAALRPPGVPLVLAAGVVGASVFLLWPRRWSAGGRPAPKRRRRGGRRATSRRRRNPRAGRGTTALALLGIGAGVLWAARQLAGQVAAIVPVSDAMVEERWGNDARAPGLGCGPCLAGASTPGYYY